MNRIKQWLSGETATFWGIVVALCLLAGLLSYLIGRDWVGKYLAQQQEARASSELRAAAATSSASVSNISLGPTVIIREREPTEAEKRELGMAGTENPEAAADSGQTGPGEEPPAAEPEATPDEGDEPSTATEGPAEDREPAATPSEPAPAARAATHSWVTTAGSYRDRRNAEQVAQSLAAQGIRAEVQAVEVRGETYHRVRVGPYDSRSAAERASDEVRAAGYPSQVLREP